MLWKTGIILTGLILALNATGCILAAKPLYDLVTQEGKEEEKETKAEPQKTPSEEEAGKNSERSRNDA